MNSVRSLVVGIAFQQMADGKPETPNFNKLEFWKHSLAVATAARILGRIRMPEKAEELYCAGVMHDVGMLVQDRFMPGEFQEAIQMSQHTGMPLYECEKTKYRFTHADVGGLLASHWSLTPMLKSAIQYHHDPMRDQDFFESTMIVAVADAIAYRCGYGNSTPDANHELANGLAAIAGLTDEHLDKVVQLVSNEVELAQAALAA
jgi:HD-like signal output (HDOD) protein